MRVNKQITNYSERVEAEERAAAEAEAAAEAMRRAAAIAGAEARAYVEAKARLKEELGIKAAAEMASYQEMLQPPPEPEQATPPEQSSMPPSPEQVAPPPTPASQQKTNPKTSAKPSQPKTSAAPTTATKKAKSANAKKGNNLIKRIYGVDKAPTSPQESIPYIAMNKNGICQVTQKKYTKSLRYTDINYQLARDEDKDIIFNQYCEFLNYFDSSVSVQLSFVNQYVNIEDMKKSIYIEEKEDEFNHLRREYSDMLVSQMEKGNNGLVKRKYITIGVEADTYNDARLRLERIEFDIISRLKVMGVIAESLDGKERLEVLHAQLHPGGNEKLNFTWDDMVISGLSTKDYIAPSSLSFKDTENYKCGNYFGSTGSLQLLASELSDKMLSDILAAETEMTATIHLQSISQEQAVKNVRRKITDVDSSKIDAQKKAARAGYGMDVIPNELNSSSDELKDLLDDLTNKNERMFLVTILINHTAPTLKELKNAVYATTGYLQSKNCSLKKLDYRQEQALMSSLVIGQNQIDINRGLTTTSTGVFIPFTTQELYTDGYCLYYGLNALSSNLIMADRRKLLNPNGLILGTPGAGKSFACKRGIVNVFLITDDTQIIIDPEGEYSPLVEALRGQVIKLSPTSPHRINPMDIDIDADESDDPVTLKAGFLLSLLELIVGGYQGLSPKERSIIDRSTRLVYRKYIENPTPENMPILEDLYNLLKEQDEPEAQHLATALEIYVTGSLNIFNNRTNVDVTNRTVCFDIKEIGNNLKKIGMLVLQDSIWTRVSHNRNKKKFTWVYIDEFHLLLKDTQTAQYSVEIFKRFRKWGGIPTGITQNVKDFLLSSEIENIVENSEFIQMLNQGAGDRAILAERLGISEQQLSHVTQAPPGEGLLFFGNTTVPFVDRFPKDTQLYRLMTTNPNER